MLKWIENFSTPRTVHPYCSHTKKSTLGTVCREKQKCTIPVVRYTVSNTTTETFTVSWDSLQYYGTVFATIFHFRCRKLKSPSKMTIGAGFVRFPKRYSIFISWSLIKLQYLRVAFDAFHTRTITTRISILIISTFTITFVVFSSSVQASVL